MDLSSQKEIQERAADIIERWPQIDILVNNAATVISYYCLTVDGIEMQFAVNHLAYFLFTHCLMNSLKSSPQARVVNVSSGNHRHGKIHFDDLNLSKNYHVLRAYNQSKLANILFTYEMHRRLLENGITNISVNCVDPGTNITDIGVKDTKFLHAMAWRIRRLIAKNPAEGAACQVYVSTSPKLKNVSGKFWYRSRPILSAKHSYEENTAKQLWEVSITLCKIKDFFKPTLKS
jgi:NAD(P)-dependent dehydrogenase (short-subunit alcohol dehydrogenase family)